jgi:hypothetical protein
MKVCRFPTFRDDSLLPYFQGESSPNQFAL